MTTLALTQEHGGSTKGLSNRDCIHGRSHVLHDIGNGKSFRFKTNRLTISSSCTTRVDVHCNGVGGRFVVEVQKFRNYKFRNSRDEGHANVDNAIVEEKGRKIRWRTDANACSCGGENG